MNERIKELKQQATLPGYMLGESYVQSRLDEQKFAELIVIECMGIVSKSGNSKAEILWNLEEFIWSNK